MVSMDLNSTTTPTPSNPIFGNSCGHIPTEPKLTPPNPAKTGKGGLPRTLTLCIERLTQYYDYPALLPSLNYANGSSRQQRSERREGAVLVQSVMLQYCDLASLCVGVPTETGFVNLSVDFIARKTGISIRRVWRALRDLRTAGMVRTSQPREKTSDGSWIGLVSVKAISKNLFGALGLSVSLDIERKKASNRLKAKRLKTPQKRATKTEQFRRALAMDGIKNTLSKSQRKPQKSPPPTKDPPKKDDWRPDRQIKALELQSLHPDWTREQAVAEALKQLP